MSFTTYEWGYAPNGDPELTIKHYAPGSAVELKVSLDDMRRLYKLLKFKKKELKEWDEKAEYERMRIEARLGP